MKKLLIVSLLLPLTMQAQLITTIAGNSFPSYGGDGFAATAVGVELYAPMDVKVDHLGNIYIADWLNNRIRKINPAGIISTYGGNGIAGFLGDGGPATDAEINGVQGIALDAAGNVYLADQNNFRVRKINTSGIISTIAGSGSTIDGGDGLPATVAGIHNPIGVTVDTSGNIYITDEGLIRKVNTAGTISTFYSNPTDPNLKNLVCDVWGNIYVVDDEGVYDRIDKINASGIMSVFAGGVAGYVSGDGGPATAAAIDASFGLGIDKIGNIYITNAGYGTIRKINLLGIINTIVGNDSTGYSGDGGPATDAELNQPYGVAIDTSGNIYIADEANNVIRKVTDTVFPIMGIASICVSDTVTFSDVTIGGKWSSSNSAIATVNSSSGIVVGLSSGIVTIAYGGIVTKSVTVNPLPFAGVITGPASLCDTGTITLSDAATGGVWAASNSNALVSSAGMVVGFSAGIDTISYSVTNTCGTISTTTIVTVNPLPNAGTILGADSLCFSDTISLGETIPGGVWSAKNGYAFISSSGLVLGEAIGIDSVFYTVSNTCGMAKAAMLMDVIECNTGVNKIDNQTDPFITLYPNPSNGSFTVNLFSATKEEAIIIITNMLGEKIKEMKISTNKPTSMQLNVQSCIYFLSVITNNSSSSEKFVIE